MRHAKGNRLHAELPCAASIYRPRSSLRYCAIGERMIFLDIAASRYFLLEGRAAGYFSDFLAGESSPEAVSWLTEQGLIERGEPAVPTFLPTVATSSLLEGPLPPPRIATVVEMLAAQALARRRVKRKPMSTLFMPSPDGHSDIGECIPLIAAFQRAARYFQADDQCLANAVALRSMLARRSLRSTLVIGVRLPFAAHCWVQSGDYLLSDPLDRVMNFEPIAAVS
ncbi:MAG: lasso peptide biosynthesis B2 protein [Sphingopyxis terrae]|nr:lasso peptide biosynthesis B2 protein [Sphingopyxis terrae]